MIQYVTETGSTNSDLADRLNAQEHVAEGDWLVSDRQSAGRGRQGRMWFDGYGNFMGSTIVQRQHNDPPVSTLALLAGLALYEVCLPLCRDPATLMLKWPNDLLLGGAKLSGILLEGVGDAVVVGIGVNLAVAPDLPDRETVALAQFGPAPDRDIFAQRLADQFATDLERWRSYGIEPMLRRWTAVGHPVGTALSVHDGNSDVHSGHFAGLREDGSLTLRLADGTSRIIHAGDILLA